MIVTLTLNPAIDKSIEVDQLIPEKKMRCAEMIIEAGGGGINISKALAELGQKSTAVFPFGGFNGQLLTETLSGRNIALKPIEIKNCTRENIVITEVSTNKQYRFVMPGSKLDGKELTRIKEVIADLREVSYLIVSGSIPPNVPNRFLSEIADIAHHKAMKLIVDTSGEPLREVLMKGVYLIKPNLSELCFLVGKKYLEPDEVDDAAYVIMNKGYCEAIVVSMGPAGAMLVTKKTRNKYFAPTVKKKSTVGAGDSMIAGIVYMLHNHKSLEEAVQFGIACGTATTINKGTQLFKKDDAFKFYDWMLSQNKQTQIVNKLS